MIIKLKVNWNLNIHIIIILVDNYVFANKLKIIKSNSLFPFNWRRFMNRLLNSFLFLPDIQFLIKLIMFKFQMLVQRAFRSIWSLTGINWTSIMSLNLICSSSKSFLSVLITSLPFLNLLSFLFQFGKFRAQLIPLIDQLSHLWH